MSIFPATPGTAWPGQITPGDPGGTPGILLNSWPATITNDPGLLTAAIANQDGATLVAFIGWNCTTLPGAGIVSVADDAHNFWQPLGATNGTRFQGGSGVGGAIWIASKADPATVVNISCTTPVSSMAALIVQFPGMPQLATIDFSQPSNATLAPPASFSISSAASALDWGFGVATFVNNTDTFSAPSGPWIALPTVSSNDPGGAGGRQDITIVPVYGPLNAGAVSASWGITGSATAVTSGVIAGIQQAFTPVTNPNPNWPKFIVQAAFNQNPGQGVPVWTDITSYAIFDDSDSILKSQRGRSYELTGPEAGTLQVWLNNQTGAFTPGNTASPFYPGIVPEVPIRVLATWNNEVYPVGYGRVDKWPQSFIMPQWGMANVSASDSMGVMANVTLNSAFQSEILIDQPYSYWPFAESYANPNGLPFGNLGISQQPMTGLTGLSSTNTPLSTGLSLNLQGDQGTGVGLSGLTVSQPTWSSGAICRDNALPQPANGLFSNGVTVEFVCNLPTTPPPGDFVTPIVSLLGSPTNFASGGGPVRFRAAAVSAGTTYNFHIVLADFLGNSFVNGTFAQPNDGNSHHHVFTFTYSGTTASVSHYLDGAFDKTVTTTAVVASSDITTVVAGPCLITPLAAAPYNYTIGHLALYNGALHPSRIAAHYNAGFNGDLGDTAVMRFKRIMAWSKALLPMAATAPSAAPLMGAAFSLGGQTGTDAFNDLLVSEGGYPYADAGGTSWWLSRASLYNKTAKWVFGDNGTTEIPFGPDDAFDFDNAFLYVQTQATRAIGQTTQITTNPTEGAAIQQFLNTGAIVTVNNQLARAKYGPRNSLQQTILTSSDQDVQDRANWSNNKYSATSLRVPKLTIDAASNPSLWPVLLGIEQGDIVQINRRPLGGAPYSVMGVVIQVSIDIGVNKGQGVIGVVPYNIESNIAQLDVNGFNTLASGIGW